MVYVDKNGQKCEYQYCIVLTEGKDAGLKHYVWASEKQIRKAMDILVDELDAIPLDGSNFEGLLRKPPNISACFNKEKIGSLEFYVNNEPLANFVAEETGLPLPFACVKQR